MIGFPNAKINLGLYVVSKRTDGFHNLETVFYPLPLRDTLEITPSADIRLILSGIPVSGPTDDNLVMSAYYLLKERFPKITPLEIHLHKSIPAGAGLGGGSSDAAVMLKLLNDYFKLEIPKQQLESFALQLGSDCPFFLKSLPCYARGRGEILEPVSLDLSSYSFLLIHPEEPVSTSWAFSQIQDGSSRSDIRKLIAEPVNRWRDRLGNDFEIAVFKKYPHLQKIKTQLYEAGACYASMTGSGSSFYGIFEKNQIPIRGIDVPARQSFIP